MMSSAFQLVIVTCIIFIVKNTQADNCAYPAQEGSAYNLTININALKQSIDWKPTKPWAPNLNKPVSECDLQNSPHCKSNFGYSGSLQHIKGDNYKATLTIESVRWDTHGRSWSWIVDGKPKGQCNLVVYSKIPKPTCDSPQMHSNNTRVRWTCSVSHVFPGTGCLVTYNNDDDRFYRTLDDHYISKTTGKLTGTPAVYDKNTCSVDVPVGALFTLPDTYRLKMTMFPANYSTMDSASTVSDDINLHPPLGPPSIFINNQKTSTNEQNNKGIASVIDGEDIVVKCLVDGGQPAVSSAMLDCGNLGSKHTAGYETSVRIHAEKEMNGKKCVCSAEHVTSLYDKKTEIVLNIQYQPNITLFEVNGQMQAITVNATDMVNFSCTADGNPNPKLSMVNEWTGLAVGPNIYTSSGKYEEGTSISRAMQCRDTGPYRCTAENLVNTVNTDSIFIYVQCPVELKAVEDGVRRVAFTNVSSTVIEIDVIGYPAPNSFGLTRLTEPYSDNEMALHSGNDELFRNLTLLPGTNVTVDDHVYAIFYKDNTVHGITGQYLLSVGNGFGDHLKFTIQMDLISGDTKKHDECDIDNKEEETFQGLSLIKVVAIGTAALFLMFLIGLTIGCKVRRNKIKHAKVV